MTYETCLRHVVDTKKAVGHRSYLAMTIALKDNYCIVTDETRKASQGGKFSFETPGYGHHSQRRRYEYIYNAIHNCSGLTRYDTH
jgi:hypothetical protein